MQFQHLVHLYCWSHAGYLLLNRNFQMSGQIAHRDAHDLLETCTNAGTYTKPSGTANRHSLLQPCCKCITEHLSHKLLHALQEKAGSEAKQITVESFPVGTKLLNELMAKLMAEIKHEPVLRSKLYQTNFHTTLSGEAIITLIYHRKLDDAWSEAAEVLRTQLGRSEPAHFGISPVHHAAVAAALPLSLFRMSQLPISTT